jgi:hypothetical protein
VSLQPRLLLVCLFVQYWCAPVWGSEAKSTKDPAAALESLDRHYAQQLAVLAEKCDSLNLPAEATATRSWQVPRTSGRTNLYVPPASEPNTPPRSSDLAQKWEAKFRSLRREQAESLFGVALEFLAAGDGARAYQLLHEVLREHPDHPQARRALGYTKSKNGQAWTNGADTLQSASGKTNQPKTGWQAGRYWRIETPHWRIATNHSATAGIDLAKRLSDFHILWRQTFFDYWCTADDLRAALDQGQRLPQQRLPMNVLLFRSREEYLKYLSPNLPNADITQGIYLDEQETAVFYMADDSVHSTWNHEAAHQLFQQWHGSPAGVGSKQNFWLVEGAAMYVESLVNQGAYWTVGGWQADRLQFARYRALAGDFKPPLADVVAMNRAQVQENRDIQKLYPYFAAVCHLVFDHPDPAIRRAGSRLLQLVYRQEDQINSLAALTGRSLSELDGELLASLQVRDEDLLTTPNLTKIRRLSLGRTYVTDQGIAALDKSSALLWLDLTALPISDEAFGRLPAMPKLEQLFLEGTKLTDKSVPQIAENSTLEELDLSRLAVTDQSVPALGKLRKLKLAYLTGTQITPAGLNRLRLLLPKATLEQ